MTPTQNHFRVDQASALNDMSNLEGIHQYCYESEYWILFINLAHPQCFFLLFCALHKSEKHFEQLYIVFPKSARISLIHPANEHIQIHRIVQGSVGYSILTLLWPLNSLVCIWTWSIFYYYIRRASLDIWVFKEPTIPELKELQGSGFHCNILKLCVNLTYSLV